MASSSSSSFLLSSSSSSEESGPSLLALFQRGSRVMHAYLDRSTLYIKTRWVVFLLLLLLYIVRVWWLQGYFVVTYGLGIYLLNLLIGFISPQVDPETEELVLPVVRDAEEYKPFQRQLLEFKCWTAGSRALLLSLLLTCFSVCDLPVFWPILLIYFLLLFFLTMKQQVKRMIKYKYLPFSWGKQTYGEITRSKLPGGGGGGGAAAGGGGGGVAGGGGGGGAAAAAGKPVSCYMKPQQQRQNGGGYYYNVHAVAPGGGTAPGAHSTAGSHAAASPAVACASGGRGAATTTAFTAADHFTTPYVLR